MNIDKDVIFEEAFNRCMNEMYEKSQPSASWDEYVEKYRSGELTKDDTVYNRHFLPHNEFNYILDKYVKAYHFEKKWKSDVEVVEKYLKEGGTKDKWIKKKKDKDSGVFESGYRGYEKVPPIEKLIEKALSKLTITDKNENVVDQAKLSKKIAKIVLDDIKTCKNFFMFDRIEDQFRCAVCLGASPTSNPKTVKEYWESQGKNLEIDETDHDDNWYWCKDTYGPNYDPDTDTWIDEE